MTGEPGASKGASPGSGRDGQKRSVYAEPRWPSTLQYSGRGALGVCLWRRCQTCPGESSNGQPPTKQESSFARMKPLAKACGRCHKRHNRLQLQKRERSDRVKDVGVPLAGAERTPSTLTFYRDDSPRLKSGASTATQRVRAVGHFLPLLISGIG